MASLGSPETEVRGKQIVCSFNSYGISVLTLTVFSLHLDSVKKVSFPL